MARRAAGAQDAAMNPVRSRAWLLALVAGIAMLVAACGSKEPAQRAAFTQFLQTRILDRPGVRVPRPTEEEAASFGPYAAHYAVITEFTDGMNDGVGRPMSDIVRRGSLRSVSDVIARRDDLKTVRESLGGLRATLDRQLAQADAAHAKLEQPADLKAVYDKAYDRTVTTPAQTFKEVFPAVDATLAQALKVADFLHRHQAAVQVSGASVAVRDAAVLNELNGMLQELQRSSAALAEAQRKLQAVMRGA